MNYRTTKPEAGNKYFIRKATGGYSTCIQGKPTDPDCNVLSNCVGYADGAYNEEHEFGYEKYHLNCNAENFIERAIASGLSVYLDPVPGGIMVWRKGDTLSPSDGAGHVAICTQEIVKGATAADDYVITSDSSYGGKAFLRIKRKRGSNGNWGSGKNYHYRGCIAPEGYKPTPTPTPEDYPFDGIVKKGAKLYNAAGVAYKNPAAKDRDCTVLGEQNNRYKVNCSAFNPNIVYCDKTDVIKKDTPTPTPTPTKLKVGDKVKIIGTGKASSYGDNPTAGGVGWTRVIQKIYEGRPYPYQVGNSTGTTGFYKESALKKV